MMDSQSGAGSSLAWACSNRSPFWKCFSAFIVRYDLFLFHPSLSRAPALHRLISARRGNARPIGRPGQGKHWAIVTTIGGDMFSLAPDFYEAEMLCRRETSAVGRPGHCPSFAGMPMMRQDGASGGCAPYLHGLIGAGGGNAKLESRSRVEEPIAAKQRRFYCRATCRACQAAS